MKSKKGFTLVELLVTIVILGIVTGISIPIIRNVQSSMTKKKYTTYYNGLKSSAKLYNDSYGEDYIGSGDVGVYCIKYKELEKRKLLKDINIENVTCDKEKTFVRVTKIEDKYVYSPYLECGKKDEEESDIYMPEGSKEREISLDFCKIEDNATILITADLSQTNGSANKKRKKTKVTLASYTGIYNDVNIKAQWVKENEEIDEKKFEPLTFKIKENQKETLLKEGIVTTTSKEIVTPQGGNGKYYLVLEVNKLVDLYGREWKNNKPEDGKYVKLGPFIVDNQKPTIENLKVISTNKNYNAIDTKVEFTGTDNLTPQNNLRMCIKEGSYCTNYKKYAQSTALKLSGGYDGKERTIYVSLIDLAGNVRQTTVKYRVAITHKLTYNSNGGSACNPTTKSITHNVGDNTKWGTLCAPTKKGYTFSGWKNGNTTVTKNTVVNGNITVKASWTANKYTVTFNGNGGSVSPGNKQVTYDSTYGTLPTPTRTGYTFIGWFDTTKSKKSNSTYKDKPLYYYADINADLYRAFGYDENKLLDHYWNYGRKEKRTTTQYSSSTKVTITANQTLYAGWVPTQYTVTFNANGGSVSPGSKKVYYNKTYGTLPTPTRSGYIFIGWYTSGNFDSNYYSNTYSDIKNAFGTNYQKLVDHWIHNGIKEGRSGSANYRKANDTFKLTSNQTLYAGWVRYGANSSCGCASYKSCATAACGTTTTSYKSCTGWKDNGDCDMCGPVKTCSVGYYSNPPGCNFGSNSNSNHRYHVTACTKIKTGKNKGKYIPYWCAQDRTCTTKYNTVTNTCRNSACGCESYYSCYY